MLELRREGDFINANTHTGLTDASLCALLGRIELILFAGGLAALASTGRTCRRHAPRVGWLVARASVGLTIFAVAIVAGAIVDQSFVHDGRTHFVVCDDAMIAMRYAMNVVHGLGPVYNAGEHVEGYTGPLWVAVLALIQLVQPSVALAPLLVLIASLGCVVATLWALEGAMKSYGASSAWVAVTGAALVADRDTMTWALSGLETPAVTAVLTGSVFAMATGRKRLFAVLLSLLPIVRSDAAIVAVPLAVLFVVLAADRARAVRLVSFAAMPALFHLAFRIAYYGAWFPNTYYLKSMSLPDRLITGFGGFGMRLVYLHAAPILTAVATLSTSKAPAWLRGAVCVALVQIAYGILVGGDSFELARFYTPVLPIVAMACVWSLRSVTRRSARVGWVPMVAAFGLVLSVYAPLGALGIHHPDPAFPIGSLEAADLLRSNLPRGALVTVSYAGTTPYYDTEHSFLDVLGKSDAHIAHMMKYQSRAIGHNKFDFGYVYDVRRPEVALLHHGCELTRMPTPSPGDLARRVARLPPWITPANFYETSHPTFVGQYLPNRVQIVGTKDVNYFGCFFVRKDSGIPMFWSANGPPPRMRETEVEFQSGRHDDRVVFDYTWSPIFSLPNGKLVRRTSSGGRSSIDFWLEPSSDVSVEVCSLGRHPNEVHVNDANVPLSYDGDCGHGTVGRHILGLRRASTRLTIVDARIDLLRLSVRPSPE